MSERIRRVMVSCVHCKDESEEGRIEEHEKDCEHNPENRTCRAECRNLKFNDVSRSRDGDIEEEYYSCKDSNVRIGKIDRYNFKKNCQWYKLPLTKEQLAEIEILEGKIEEIRNS